MKRAGARERERERVGMEWDGMNESSWRKDQVKNWNKRERD